MVYGEDRPGETVEPRPAVGCTESAAASSAVSGAKMYERPAACAVTPGQEDDEPIQRIVPGTGGSAGFRPEVLVVSQNKHRRVPACKIRAQPSRRDRRDRHWFRETRFFGQACGFRRGDVRICGNLVTWWTGDALLVFDATPSACRWRATAPVGPGGDDGRSAPGAGHRQDRLGPVSNRCRPQASAVIPAVSGSRVVTAWHYTPRLRSGLIAYVGAKRAQKSPGNR